MRGASAEGRQAEADLSSGPTGGTDGKVHPGRTKETYKAVVASALLHRDEEEALAARGQSEVANGLGQAAERLFD